ncbi:unnamed protein product [Gordionus sp. m RMFG-2023]|uniref:exostosin-1-like n=1 Tax=Gordionus sp. m RMFG-2023 TaxID=3053472 RepID=UPI0030DF41AC
MYSGTYPKYSEKLDINIENAMLISANLITYKHRNKFDLSLPLFNNKFVVNHFNKTKIQIYNPNKKYLLSFKGKRYLYGYGSETRNSLHYLHDGEEIILLTTCKHGNWEKYKDERCDNDNTEYDKYDYDSLLTNSIFCLVPRGRRLASYRFLEVLRFGCIPVILSNGWLLPFSEVIDWSEASIVYDEDNLYMLTDFLYSITEDEIMKMRKQVYVIYNNYFSSFQKIVNTITEILKDRISPAQARPHEVWNTYPGALNVDFSFSTEMRDFPFYQKLIEDFEFRNTYVVSILVSSHQPNFSSGSNLNRIFLQCTDSKLVSQIVLIWLSPATPPISIKKLHNIPVTILHPPHKDRGRAKFWHHAVYRNTDAILSLDENETIIKDEMNFAFDVWKSFPNTLVGYRAYSHNRIISAPEGSNIKNIVNNLDTDPGNRYSLVATSAVFYHKYYNYLYSRLSNLTHDTISRYTLKGSLCSEDIPMNMLVASITSAPPIKIGPRPFLPLSDTFSTHYRQIQTDLLENCFIELVDNTSTTDFPDFPLIHSMVRADPLLYKDDVDINRKKYKAMELVA